MDAFISHSSKNTALAAQIEKCLEQDALNVWLDRSEIRLGVLLRNELQVAIQNSRVLILLWSRPAANSRWVAAELLSAFHLNRFIIPCVLDNTQLPYFLQPTVYLDLRRQRAKRIEGLGRTVREAPNAANDVRPIMSSQSPEVSRAIHMLATAQRAVLTQLQQRNPGKAQEIQNLADDVMKHALQAWVMDQTILNLAGYHCKNAYMIKHWDAIQAGVSLKDPLLQDAERFFFRTLFINPKDYSALNGLGSILIMEQELDAAEFFIQRAIALAEQDQVDYIEAKQDLAMITRYKQKPRS